VLVAPPAVITNEQIDWAVVHCTMWLKKHAKAKGLFRGHIYPFSMLLVDINVPNSSSPASALAYGARLPYTNPERAFPLRAPT